MRYPIFHILLSALSLTSVAQGVTSINRELPRASFVSYRNAEQALARDITKSENFADLSGEWLFTEGSDLSAAKLSSRKFLIPSAVELDGIGSAIYSEKAYPFLKTAPSGDFTVSDKEPMIFSREFSVPLDYVDRILYLHIGAAKSSVTVYINGKEVGYSTDSRNPAEFEITKYVVRGSNQLALKVDKYSDGSYLEDQSEWRLSGLNRDIYMFAQPKIRVRDYTVNTKLDPTYTNGMLETSLLLKTELLNTHTVKVYYDLYDPQGNLVNQANKEVTLGMRGEDTVRFSATILDVKQWNAETPNLYTIMYRVQREGRFTEYVTVKAGFRTVEIRDGKMLVNGKAIKIKGVNYAEFSPSTGNVLTEIEMRESLKQMKFAGINAIRTDGYPLPAHFYDVCDEMGIYVADVANVNAQGVGTSTDKGKSLANAPAWCDNFVYRVNNTYERNKAHTSVVMWALGDNAGNGYNMYEAYLMLKAKERNRPVVYNGAGTEFNTDIFCPDYMSLSEIGKQTMDGQPIIFSRCPFDETIWESDVVQGGFINRWQEPSIVSSARFAELSDSYKLTERESGMVDMPSAKRDLKLITDIFCGVKISVIDWKKSTFELENRLDFANINELKVVCQLLKDGKMQREYDLKIDAAPGKTTTFTIPKNKLKDMFVTYDEITITVGNVAQYSFKN